MTRSKAPDRLRKAWAAGASGAIIRDTEDRQYIDMVCGLGAISLGYGRHWDRGTRGVYSLPHRVEIDAAEAVLKHVAPWASQVRFVKTGSEATHAAYRIAKAVTGRKHVWVGKGAYHGWHEWCSDLDSVYSPDWGGCIDFASTAAVFYEPPRFEPVDVAWLRWLREECTKHGTLLVFDEMIYGGRWALGGCTEYHGVVPDIACFGKAFANGEAAAFVVGGDALARHGELVSGTFSGCATGLQAVVDTLGVYTTEPVIDTLWKRARLLRAAFTDAVPADFCTLTGPAPLMGLRFANPEHKEPFKHAMHERGVLMWPDWLMVMHAHTSEHMAQVADAAGAACRAVR